MRWFLLALCRDKLHVFARRVQLRKRYWENGFVSATFFSVSVLFVVARRTGKVGKAVKDGKE
jgi:hypothetical protein